jgi:hypothetical protein
MPMPEKSKGKSKWKASFKTPNASFRTRHRSISINLATTGSTTINNKAYVQVSAHKGDININMYSLQKGKHINLDAYSRHGGCSATRLDTVLDQQSTPSRTQDMS